MGNTVDHFKSQRKPDTLPSRSLIGPRQTAAPGPRSYSRGEQDSETPTEYTVE